MPTPRLSDEKIAKIADLKASGLTNREIAKQARVAIGTVSKVLNQQGQSGAREVPRDEVNTPIDSRDETGGDTTILTPDRPLTLDEMYDMFGIDRKVWLPVNVTTNQWQGFYKIKTEDGAGHRKVALWQTKVSWKRIMGETVQTMLLDFFRNNVEPLPKPDLPRRAPITGNGVLVTWGLWDAHLGLYAWQSETGESMDLTKAISRVTNSVDDMAGRLAEWPDRVEQIVMPIGNDFMHYDNVRQKTTYGEHHLDADGRYAKVYTAALRCLIYMVERAVELTDRVRILYVPGNHDLTSSYTLCVALSQRFKNDKRVEFDLSANPRKYMQYGGTLLGFNHGQGANARQLATIFSTECAKEWSSSTYREIQIGHTHQGRMKEYESVTPTNGVKIRTHPALCAADYWHHNNGFIGEPVKSVEAQVYDRLGLVASLTTWARDDCSNAAGSVDV